MTVHGLAAARRWGLSLRSIGLSALSLVGILTLGCKCTRTRDLLATPQRSVALAVSQPSAPLPAPLDIDQTIVTLNRSRKFAEVVKLLDGISSDRANQPSYRFVRAAVSVKTNNAAAAIASLDGLEHKLPDLTPEIEMLRARAKLQTADALVGAAWLSDHGQLDVWLEAARNLRRIEQRELAVSAIDKGLGAVRSTSSARSRALVAGYRALRAEICQKSGDASCSLEDLRWLAVEAPTHIDARPLLQHALEAGTLGLDVAQQRERLRRMADAGAVTELDAELQQLTQRGANRFAPSLVAYLRGRARQVARVDQVEGAKLLNRAAELNIEDAVRIRIDAARLWVREGQLGPAVALYDRIAILDRNRSEEAQFYAARSMAVLGEQRRAVGRYTNLIERFPSGRWRRAAELERVLLWLALAEFKTAEVKLLQLLGDSHYRDQRPQLLELAGLAGALSGRKDVAIERWLAVVKEAPLSLAAAFAVARLRQLDVVVERKLPSAASDSHNEPVRLSRRINQLIELGFDEMAADALRQDELTLKKSTLLGVTEFGCRAWAAVGYGERGFQWSRSIRDSVDLKKPLDPGDRWRWECRFPRPYRAMADEFEAEYRLPPYLLSAVMRQESSFDPKVQSPADAVGLLQLLPQTANRVAEEFQLGGDILLEEPRTNLRLGAAYLRKLLDLFGGNLALAVAAYNAGPQAVELWRKHAGSGAVELFLARIPYAETQKYVERVLGNLVVYRYLNGSSPDFDGLSLSLPEELKVSGELY